MLLLMRLIDSAGSAVLAALDQLRFDAPVNDHQRRIRNASPLDAPSDAVDGPRTAELAQLAELR